MGQISKLTNMGDMRKDKNIKPDNRPAKKPGIYKIYMPKETLLKLCGKKINVDKLEKKIDVLKNLVLVYIGLSKKLSNRICSDHLRGDHTSSSVQNRIKKFLEDSKKDSSKESIKNIIDLCWVEWEYVDSEWIGTKEQVEIATHYLPFNTKNNEDGC
ncbi:MAG: hypothetical protein LBB23_00400 [Rickettsiales bacterium]|jgi:hypothetical protein|nr:hypothetical protein [Rickettsiales bacterium]